MVVLLVAQVCDCRHLYRKIPFELTKTASISHKTALFLDCSWTTERTIIVTTFIFLYIYKGYTATAMILTGSHGKGVSEVARNQLYCYFAVLICCHMPHDINFPTSSQLPLFC
jgi:hypothetical protein